MKIFFSMNLHSSKYNFQNQLFDYISFNDFEKEENLRDKLIYNNRFDVFEQQFDKEEEEILYYNSSDCFDNKQNGGGKNDGFLMLTEIEKSKLDSSKKEIFAVDHLTNKSKKKKINNFINKKTKRKENEININQKIITQKETNRNYKAEDTFIKEGDAFPNSSNLKDRVLKPFCNSVVEYLKKIGRIKSEIKIDLSFTSLGYEKIIKIMDLPFHQIICFFGDKENVRILQKAEFENGKNKKLFEDILNLRLKDLLRIYYNQSNEFDINDNGTIIKFPKLDEVLEEMYENYIYKDQRIYNIKVMTRRILSDFKINFDKRQPNGKKEIDIDSIYIRRFEKFKLLQWEGQDEQDELLPLIFDCFNCNQKNLNRNEQEERIMSKKDYYYQHC